MQPLDTMNKLRDITLDKLPLSLRNWTDRNLKRIYNSEKHEKYNRENIFKTKGRQCKNRESNPKTSVCNIVRNQDIKPLSVSHSIEPSSKG